MVAIGVYDEARNNDNYRSDMGFEYCFTSMDLGSMNIHDDDDDKDNNGNNEIDNQGQPFSPRQVREIAKQYGYTEISHNEVSRVICFRKGTTRINIYYTTRTVGTCLNHPKKGKTQLFRRNVDWTSLKQILENPRVHTGQGYYFSRKTKTQLWKGGASGNVLEWDSARRWRYVAMCTGLESRENIIREMERFCSAWDELYWNVGDVPNLKATRFDCGCTAALLSMIVDEAKRMHGEVLLYRNEDVGKFLNNKIRNIDLEAIEVGYCGKMNAFIQNHYQDIHRLRMKLRQFPKIVRTELIIWLLERDKCGCSLYTPNLDLVETKMSDCVNQAHLEYGETMYANNWNFCIKHGVLYN